MSPHNMMDEENNPSSGSSEDGELTKDSQAESLNSLLKTSDPECGDTCLDVKIQYEGVRRANRKRVCSKFEGGASVLDVQNTVGTCWSGTDFKLTYPVVQCVWGILLIIFSISSYVFTPLDFMLLEKLNMRPGMPPYEWWVNPPDEVKLRFYVFNVTNHERFLEGLDDKLNVQEIGPIVFLEKLVHSNVIFNDNSTMTYTAKHFPIYLPEENTIDLNDTIYVPNVAVLGMFSYLHETNYFTGTIIRSFVNMLNSKPFVTKTIYDYLWNFTDPVLDMCKTLAPGLVPATNVGMLDRIYADFTDQLTVKIGSQWGHKQFFQIDRFRGQPQLPGFDPEECPDRIFGSTEGVMYAQRLTKEDVLLYWRKTVCKLMPLYFDAEVTKSNVPLYRFNLSESAFDRVTNGTDCYDTDPSLPDGISDASKCYFNIPMAASYPHFYTGSLPKDYYVTGLQPDKYKHNSFIEVEPYTGTPFESVARLQSNLRMYDISMYGEQFGKLSNLMLPLFWAEYHQEGLPDLIRRTVYFTVVILPPLSAVVSTILLLYGFYLIMRHIDTNNIKDRLKTILIFKSKKVRQNKIYAFESESFLKAR